MKPFIIILIVLFLETFPAFSQESRGISKIKKEEAFEAPRTALVIGNASYAYAPLRNPVNDARAIASTLQELGFEVTLLEDAEQKEIKRAINKFGKTIRNGGVGLFYFSGHGMQIEGSNYLIPVGAEIESEEDVELESVSINRVLSKMDAAKNTMNVIILDACRNNPYARSFRSTTQGLASLTLLLELSSHTQLLLGKWHQMDLGRMVFTQVSN